VVKKLGAEKWLPALVLAAALLGSGCAGTEDRPGRGQSPAGDGPAAQAAQAAEAQAAQGGTVWAGPELPGPAGRFALIPDAPRLGEPVTVALVSGPPTAGLRAAELLDARGRHLSRAAFFPLPAEGAADTPLLAAILSVPSTAPPGPAVIRLEGIPGPLNTIPLSIGPRDFASEIIVLNQALTDIRTAPDPQKTAESQQLWAILSRTGGDIYCTGAFTPPVASTRRTSFFGDRRIFRYTNGKQDSSIHAGVDYGVPTGTPVYACGPGKVVLARNRIVTGKSVVLEHLPGLYSIYYHLDSIAVSEGALAAAGTLLGTVGATGLATGPHLHWEIRVSGENTDPDAFLARPLLDKKAILDRIDRAAF
jgi:murein DD-endopeptidase MepM/ murein hydrolase activator NlpD